MLPLQTIATGSKRADNTLTVAVMDKDANPIESAVLFIDDDHQTEMVTDANGAASYLLPDGTYTVYSYAANYLDRVVPVTIDGDDLQVDIVHRDAISWSTAPANAPIGVGEANGVRLAAAGDKIYLHAAFGGPPGTTDYGALFAFFEYNPQTDSWTQLPDAPYGGLYGITTAYGPTPDGDDAIYIMRGFPGGQRTWMARYDIDAGQWEDDLNHVIPWREDLGSQYGGTGFQDYPRNGAVMVWDQDDHMYLFPGSAYSYEKYDWYRYSVSNDSWEAMDALPHRQGPGNAAVFVPETVTGLNQNYIYVQFGLTPVGNYTAAEFWRYGLSSGEWENMADHAYGADDGSMLAWDGNDHIYHTPGAYVEQLWDRGQDQKRELMRFSISGNLWTEMEKAPYNRWGGWDDAGGIVRIGDALYGMKGGSDVAWAEDGYVSGGGDIPSDKVWMFHIPETTRELAMTPPSGEGRTYPPAGIYSYPLGSTIDLQAIAKPGWTFAEWRANGNHHDTSSETTITLNDMVSIEAVFEPEEFVLYAHPAELLNLNYTHGHGPSAAQTFALNGRDLDPSSGEILIEGSDHFEVSADGQSFGSETSLTYTDNILESTPVYVRLMEGLAIGTYTNERIDITGGGGATHVTASGEVSSTGLPYVQDFSGFVSNETLPDGWTLDDTYIYRGTFGENNGGGVYGNSTLGFQVTATQPNNNFTATLSLENNTGRTVSNLLVKYLGRTARNVPGTPEWTVTVNGVEQPGLAYSTEENRDREVITVLGGLAIGDEEAIEIDWFTTSAGTSGHRRQIGVADVLVDEVYPVYQTADITSVPDNVSVAVRGTVELHGTLTINHLLIEEGHALYIMPGAELTVNGTLFNLNEGQDATASLMIRSDETGTGSLIHSTPGVIAIAERYILPREGVWDDPENNTGWHLISSPVTGQAIEGSWTPDGTDDDDYAFYAWSEEEQMWLDQKDDDNEIDLFIPGKGYLVAYQSAATNIFEGAVNVSDVEDLPVTKSGSGEEYGWNLMGNPFASALHWNDDSWDLGANVGGIAKVWGEGSQSYKDIFERGIIPSMHGFFIYFGPDEKEAGTITIPAGARTHGDNEGYKETDDLLRLVARDVDHQTAQEVILRFKEVASTGFDLPYDAYFLAGHAPALYFLAGEKQLSTYSHPTWTDSLTIPMGFEKNTANEFSLELAETIPDTPVFLYDMQSETLHELTTNEPYTFSAAEGDHPRRFELRLGLVLPDKLREEPVYVYAFNNVVHLIFQDEEAGRTLEVIDIKGRKVFSRTLGHGLLHSQPLHLSQGLYIIRVTTTEGTFTEKVVLTGEW